jgi:hypothetical protein
VLIFGGASRTIESSMRQHKNLVRTLILGVLIACSSGSIANALQSSSAHYGVDETFFGSGGTLDDTCSSSYCAKQSLGETAVGASSSANFGIQAGNNTNRDNYIEFIVNPVNTNLGRLTTTTTAHTTATFSVKSYLASGYTVVNASPGPVYATHTLTNLATPTASAAGTESFGINLVANTSGCGAPANYGANPVQAPDSTFGFGQVASGYNTCGLYQYNNGDTIAYSNSSSGETDYTISYIFNISSVTPAGTYTFLHNLVATSTY